ncbi:MAG: HAMP domain-containing sensor histidine kinase [Pseudomonadota bacterium]
MNIKRYLPKRISSSLIIIVVGVLLVNNAITAGIINVMMTLSMLETSRQLTLPQLERAYKLVNEAAGLQKTDVARSLSNDMLVLDVRQAKPGASELPEPVYGFGPNSVRAATVQEITGKMGLSSNEVSVTIFRPTGVPFRSIYWGLNPVGMLHERPESRADPASTRDWLFADMQLSDGQWLRSVARVPANIRIWAWPSIGLLVLSSVLTLVLLTLIIRRITRPMQNLADAATRFGRGEAVSDLDEDTGPIEVRDMATAFNRMQLRLSQFVTDRMRMLAAISHDLRTPMTSLRINAEFVDDQEAKMRIENVLDDMQQIVESTLAFARSEEKTEGTSQADLTQMLDGICREFRQQGRDAFLSRIAPTRYRCRPVELKRAFRNLVENAIKYGHKADVDIHEDGTNLMISIIDAGPGLHPDNLEFVFKPFSRLESSRNPETGGVGLGLAIARSAIRRHGGDIQFKNLEQGGLQTIVYLPLDAALTNHRPETTKQVATAAE